MPVKDAHIVKIAVEFENHIAQLINLDQRQPLTGNCNFLLFYLDEHRTLKYCGVVKKKLNRLYNSFKTRYNLLKLVKQPTPFPMSFFHQWAKTQTQTHTHAYISRRVGRGRSVVAIN